MIDVRCPKCGRLLFKVNGLGTMIETRCPKCGAMVRWPSIEAVVVVPAAPNRITIKPVGPSRTKGK